MYYNPLNKSYTIYYSSVAYRFNQILLYLRGIIPTDVNSRPNSDTLHSQIS